MTIKDASHAVRVLEALVEGIERVQNLGGPFCGWAMLRDIASALLNQYHKAVECGEGLRADDRDNKKPDLLKTQLDWQLGKTQAMMSAAESAIPHMKTAGMKVPE